jgi:acetyl esterase/lipase
MGFSAGGHLASTLGTHFDESSRPGFMILIYPVVTLKLPLTHEGSRKNLIGENPGDELVELYPNEMQVTNDTPPTFIVHSMDDKVVLVENSLMFYQSLKEKNIPAEMHLYPYGGHGYSLALNKGRLSDWRFRLIDWLNDLAAN